MDGMRFCRNRRRYFSKVSELVFLALFFFVTLTVSASGALVATSCRNPTLGIETTNISDRIREQRQIPEFAAGALVRRVHERSPAARAHLQSGDVIQAVGATLVQNTCDFRAAIEKNGCRSVRLVIRRGNDTLRIDAQPVDAATLPIAKTTDAAACKDGDGAACTRLAHAHEGAPDLLQLACDLGDADGCYDLALKLTDDRKAAAAYQQACDGGNALACTNLGWRYERGRGVVLDAEVAARLYERGCAGGPCGGPNNVGCVNLGRFYRDGIGVKKDQRRSLSLFRLVCGRRPIPGDEEDAGTIARACSLSGTALLFAEGIPRDVPQALKLLERGCGADDTFGCYNLGAIYETGDGVPLDKARAATYYRRACDHGDQEACERMKGLP